MSFGSNQDTKRAELCYACLKPKEGVKNATISGIGFQKNRQGTLQICINPECSEGKKNIAEQEQ